MIANKLAARPVGPHPAAVRRRTRQSLVRRRGCGEVARRRAARYATKRRIPKSLWPFIAAAILVWLIFDRRAPSAVEWAGGTPDTEGSAICNTSMPEPHEGQDIDRSATPVDTGSAINGIPQPKHLPPVGFLAEEAVQVVAFLIRNRGRLDNDAVRAKWEIVDRISLPLAIYLREVEAKAAWNELEREIAVAAWGVPAISGSDLPKSPRHRKLLRLLPEWSRRGEEFLSPRSIDRSGGTWTPETDVDDDADRPPPKP